MKTLADLGEDTLVQLLTRTLRRDDDVLLGPGDDCAVVRLPRGAHSLVLKTDTIVEGVHFTPETPARWVGRKAMARVLSDFAAMAATPRHALITLIAPPRIWVKRVQGIYHGLAKLADEFEVRIVGGETSRGDQLSITVSLIGYVPTRKWITRSAARAGDVLYVTGRLGGSIRGRHLRFQPLVKESSIIAKKLKPTAMMDLSDGLAKDLPRMARASGLGWNLWLDQIPITAGCSLSQALNDGEDYHLLFATSPTLKKQALLECQALCPGVKFHAIGELTRDEKTGLLETGGWDHFL
jgi:thiamine-monophosphate kinase